MYIYNSQHLEPMQSSQYSQGLVWSGRVEIVLLPTGATCCMVVTVVLLCLSVIGIPLVIAVWYFKDAEKGKHGTN